MSDLEKMKTWLLSCPYIGTDVLHTEYTDAGPGSSGLYPMGMEVISQKEDLLGNRTVQCRYTFLLRQVVPENGTDADRLLQLQQWVQRAEGAPVFGDVPSRERISAENGKMEKASQVGTALYAVTLKAEFMKEYKE